MLPCPGPTFRAGKLEAVGPRHGLSLGKADFLPDPPDNSPHTPRQSVSILPTPKAWGCCPTEP